MSDLISRQAAIVAVKDALLAWSSMPEWRDDKITEALVELPSAQPERRKAKWIDGHCSNCGCDIPAYIIDWKWQKDMDAKFCPNCGCRMEGDDDET